MNKMWFLILYGVLVVLFFSFLLCDAQAFEEKKGDEPLYFEIEATAYCYGTTRCDGGKVRNGICAGKKEWYGKVIALYENDNGKIGKFIGNFECLDTGGDSRIKEGKCVDIYNPSYEWCINFGRKKCFAVIVDGVG